MCRLRGRGHGKRSSSIPHYYKIRNHIIHFLVRHAKHEAATSGPSTNGTPVIVNFEEESVVTH